MYRPRVRAPLGRRFRRIARSDWTRAARAVIILCFFAWRAPASIQRCKDSQLEIWEHGAWPIYMASYTFSLQLLLSCWLAMKLRSIMSTEGSWQGEIPFIKTYVGMMVEQIGLELCCTIYYFTLAWYGSWTVLHLRFLLWSIHGPLQIFLAGKTYTTSALSDLMWPQLASIETMVLGFSIFAPEGMAAWTLLDYMAGVLAGYCMIDALCGFSNLTAELSLISEWHGRRRFTVVLWMLRPASMVARRLGWLTTWQEQILVLSVLDIVARTNMMLEMFSGPLFAWLTTVLSNIRLLRASHDAYFVVDSSWRLLQDALDAEKGTDFLKLVATDEARIALQQVASFSDSQTGWIPQRIRLELYVGQGRQVCCDGMVCRCLRNRRHLVVSWSDLGHAPPTASGSSLSQGLNYEAKGPWPLSERSSMSMSDISTRGRKQIREWCAAAHVWGQQMLLPSVAVSVGLRTSFFSLFQEIRRHQIPVYARLQDCAEADMWTQWDALIACTASLAGNSPVPISAWMNFVIVLDLIKDHLQPWFEKDSVLHRISATWG
eukprot:TRINITY_DN1018_c0_g1_i1.p1 TRINITY_DN1018_c0_g1~~TRINITY_DN1018_c0_g1_i1.p1  ORF type:complete len:554 (-),score=61.62 TRINITY_DN1018_c0_g1_i1:236-1873(-)